MGKGIGRIYKYDQRNCPYPSPNNIFFILQHYETYIQTQCTSSSNASVGEHDLASSGLYQIINHRGNTDVNNNYDSQSFETPRKNNCSASCFGDTITKMTTPYSSILPPPVK